MTKKKPVFKNMVEEKLKFYQIELQQLLKTIDVYKGAIQACNQILKELDKTNG